MHREGYIMYDQMKSQFTSIFHKKAEYVFSAPGRSELSGNHTDHQHGCVLAAAINLEAIACVAKNDDNVIRIQSKGYKMCEVDLSDLSVHADEVNTTMALIRGVAARMKELGCDVKGFDAYVESTVLPGSGLSSSAAFEVLVGTIINGVYFNNKCTAVEIAQISQYAENVYFGKPCGLMDQMACSVGNIISIDFADTAKPVIERIDFDFPKAGYALCIIDSGADHADLTDEYADITKELKAVCRVFGKEFLRDVDEDAFYQKLPEVRAAAGDRGVMRAMHVFDENKRVKKQVEALKNNDFDTFLQYVILSGQSSWMNLQNVIPTGATGHQEVALALGLARKLLGGRGAYRVHGGGFAGTIQAFVPLDMLEGFKAGIEQVLGEGSCHVLSIRAEGGVMLEACHD